MAGFSSPVFITVSILVNKLDNCFVVHLLKINKNISKLGSHIKAGWGWGGGGGSKCKTQNQAKFFCIIKYIENSEIILHSNLTHPFFIVRIL